MSASTSNRSVICPFWLALLQKITPCSVHAGQILGRWEEPDSEVDKPRANFQLVRRPWLACCPSSTMPPSHCKRGLSSRGDVLLNSAASQRWMRPRGVPSKRARLCHPGSNSRGDAGLSRPLPPSTRTSSKPKPKSVPRQHSHRVIHREPGMSITFHLSNCPTGRDWHPAPPNTKAPSDRPPVQRGRFLLPGSVSRALREEGAALPGRGRSPDPHLPVGLRALHPAAA